MKVVEVGWSDGEGGRPAQVYSDIVAKLGKFGLKAQPLDTITDDIRFVIYKPSDLDTLVNIVWDWKEPRENMINDLDNAMADLNVPVRWRLKKK